MTTHLRHIRLLAGLLLSLAGLSASAAEKVRSPNDVSLSATKPLHCPESTHPLAYRVGYIAVNQAKVNFPGVVFICLEHELRSQEDWVALQNRIVGDGLEITIMGANRVPSSDKSP